MPFQLQGLRLELGKPDLARPFFDLGRDSPTEHRQLANAVARRRRCVWTERLIERAMPASERDASPSNRLLLGPRNAHKLRRVVDADK